MRRFMGHRTLSAAVVTFTALFLVAVGTGAAEPVADTAASAGKSVKKALRLSKSANSRSKKALATAKRADANATAALAKGGPQGLQGPKGDTGAQGDPGPVVTAGADTGTDVSLSGGPATIVSASVTTTSESRIMATASVDGVANGGNDDEMYCFIADSEDGNSANDFGQRHSAGLPAVEGGFDDNETVLTVTGSKVRAAGTHTIYVRCGTNNGTVTTDSANVVVWVGQA